MPCESRALRFGSYIAALIFLPAVCCHGQGGLAGSVTGVNVMPAPGAGHDYIHLLSETVDPSVGQVSVRITPPMPPGRGLTIPFSINYDSGSVYLLKNIPSGSLWYNSPTVEGGWHYSVLPTLTGDSWTSSLGSGTTEVDCTFFSAYTFTDASGTGHNLGLGSVSQSGPGVVTGSYPCGTPITLGGDSQVLAYSNGGNSGPGQIYVQDKDGTTYIFSGTAIVSGTPAVSVEDRNGNEITLTEPSSGIYGYPLGYTDSLGRPVVSVTGSGQSGTQDTATVGGLAYEVAWTTVSASFSAPNNYIAPGGGVGCSATSVPAFSGSQTVVSSITLPNQTQYKFSYDSYGLLNKITYPEGGWVQYTWSTNPQATGSPYSILASFSGTNGTQSIPNACLYQYTTPQIIERQVSFDGSTVALTQTFAPTTSWRSPVTGNWSSKQNKVATTDAVQSLSFSNSYTYSPILVSPPAYVGSSVADQIAVEQSVTTATSSGTVLDQETKNWYDPFELACDVDTVSTSSSALVQGHFYQYYGGNVSDDKEYDFNQVSTLASSCLSNSAPSTPAPRRETGTTYQTFTNALAARQGGLLHFYKPQAVKVYTNGSEIAETDYAYNPAVSAVPSGPAVDHDETVYSASRTPDRGDPTTITKACLSGCSNSPVTTLSYDATGQITSVVDPCGASGANCSDMAGTSHTTTYSYTYSYSSCSGSAPPATPTNAYLSQVTYPQTSGVSHAVSYCYDYTTGLLHSSTDENKNSTQYSYNDPLNRLKLIQRPDGGSTAISYNDTVLQPTQTTTVAINTSGTSKTTEVTMDGLWRPIQSQITSDPSGAVITDTIYDGLGQVQSVSNPYRSPTEATYGTTTYSYDALGRKTLQTNPGGSTGQWCYEGISGNNCAADAGQTSTSASWVDFTDENGNDWQRRTDALGRLTQVREPGGAMTYYSYDGLDNLLCAAQDGGAGGTFTSCSAAPPTWIARSFTYDSLSRLITANNPETGTICYGTSGGALSNAASCASGYDGNGNLGNKTDSRGVVVSYRYDSLNRLLSKTYSNDGNKTTSSCFQYDSATNGTGRLGIEWTQSASSGACPGAAPSSGIWSKRSILAYDTMGRIMSEQQCTPYNCASGTPYAPTYTHDLAGNLSVSSNGITSTPVVNTLSLTNDIDAVDRLAGVTSNWSDATHPSSLFSAQTVTTTPPCTSSQKYPFAAFGGLMNASYGGALTLNRGYDNRLRATCENDAGSLLKSNTGASATVTITGEEQSK